MSLLTFPDGGEYANETYFLTDLAYQQCAQYAVLQGSGVQAAAHFTDGVQQKAVSLARRLPHLPSSAPFFSVAALPDFTLGEREGFLHSQKLAKHTSDDMTLVTAVRDDYLFQT